MLTEENVCATLSPLFISLTICLLSAALLGDDADTKPPSPTKSVVEHASPNGKANGNGTMSSRKRAREEEDDTDNEDRSRTQSESRAVKPRTENYKPPEGIWRRLTNSFRSFIDGFRQGLAADEVETITEGEAKAGGDTA